jgi:hypothetical protein
LLGHLRWGGQLFAPVVEELLDLLRQSPVVQGDETGWRINGQTAWAGCFRDPRLALFLIDRHRSRDVLTRVLGATFAGTLVSDFYAAYNGLDCPKQPWRMNSWPAAGPERREGQAWLPGPE